MKEVLLKKVKIDGVILNISDDQIYKNSLDKKDWLIYLLYRYNKKLELVPRKKIEVIESDISNLEEYIGKEIIIKTRSKTKIGTCKVNKDLSLEPKKFYILEKDYKLDEYSNLFEHYVNRNKTDTLNELELKKYISGLFKIYYDSIKYLFSMNNTAYVEKKETAMASYRAIRDNLSKYNFSEPNVFIKNKPLEYDALILKTKKNNEYLYNESDILATLEIKSSGYRGSKNEENINKYTKHIAGAEINEERIEGIPHIYFAIFEQPNNYKILKHHKNFKDIIMIVCASKINNSKFLIPKDYDVDLILTKLLKK